LLILGLMEQWLGHHAEAAEAYRKYLASSPPATKAAKVRQWLAEVEVRSETQRNAEDEAALKNFGPRAWAVGFGFSPLQTSAIASQLGGGPFSKVFHFFGRAGNLSMGVRFGRRDLTGTIQAAPKDSAPPDSTTTPTFSSLSAESLSFWGLDFGYDFGLLGPHESLGPIQIFLPARAGGIFGNVTASGRDFSSVGVDLATGLGAALYTKSWIAFELLALYHFDLAFGPQESDMSPTIRTAAGEDVTGSFGGFELRFAVRILFGEANL